MINDQLFLKYLKINETTDQSRLANDAKNGGFQNEIRNPFVEENEIKYVKEPVPYGNPFKLVLRSKTQKLVMNGEISDEAYLANIIQEKEVKGVSKNAQKESMISLKKSKSIETGLISFSIFYYLQIIPNISLYFFLFWIIFL